MYWFRNGIKFLTTRARDWKEAAQWEVRSQWKQGVLTGRIGVTLHVFFADQRKRDLDNTAKPALDSLTGIVFEDDSQVMDLHMLKDVDRDKPRMEIWIKKLP